MSLDGDRSIKGPPVDPSLEASSNPATEGRGQQREGWERFPWEKFGGFVVNEGSKRTGWTWEHGFDVKRHDGSSHWVCGRCVTKRSPRPAIFAAAGTANQAKHLVNEHRIDDPTGKRPAKRAKISVAERLLADVTKPPEQALVNRLIQSFNPVYFQQLLVDWITHDNISFHKVESPYFRRLMEYTNPTCAPFLPSHPTLRKWLVDKFNRHKGIVTELLLSSPGLIHLSFDGWTSNNHKSLLGVVVHFLGPTGKLRQFTIGLPQQDSHSGVDMAEEVAQILAVWGISDKIGYIVTDNASNNDVAIRLFTDWIRCSQANSIGSRNNIAWPQSWEVSAGLFHACNHGDEEDRGMGYATRRRREKQRERGM